MAAFHADQRGNFALTMDALDVGDGERELESVGVTGDELMDDVNLFEHGLDGGRTGRCGGNIDGPELRAEAAGAEAGDVGDKMLRKFAGVRGEVDAVNVLLELAELPGEVVVAVDKRAVAEELADFGEAVGGLRSGGHSTKDCENSDENTETMMEHIKAAQGDFPGRTRQAREAWRAGGKIEAKWRMAKSSRISARAAALANSNVGCVKCSIVVSCTAEAGSATNESET